MIDILIELLEEGVDTWRPTKAMSLDGGLFELQPADDYDPENEAWAFLPGSKIRLEEKVLGDGKKYLVARHHDLAVKRIDVEGDGNSTFGINAAFAREVAKGVFDIIPNPNPTISSEGWKFQPGDKVKLKTKRVPGGKFTIASKI